MFSRPIQNLIDFFLKFPGVGPRQAARFAFHLLRSDRAQAQALAAAIGRLQDEVKLCSQCYKTFSPNPPDGGQATAALCELCRSSRRNQSQVMVVEKEVDLENVERTGKYEGLYHVLGGTIDPLDSAAPARLHIRELFLRLKELAGAAQASAGVEVILATNPTTDGDATALYLERVLEPLNGQHPQLKVSRLGRGLGTGAELEYADEVTIANALENRK